MAYLMESDDEAVRLEEKTEWDFTLRNLRLAGLRSGMRALDVGCGSGAVTRAMASVSRQVPSGVDSSQARISAANELAVDCRPTPSFVCSDAADLPFAFGEFDFVWSRFLFEYAPNPTAILKEMIRVVRPGGLVAVADLDGQMTQFHPKSDELGRLLDKAMSLLAIDGFDPFVGRKLYKWFFDSKLLDLNVHTVPYQNYFGGLKGTPLANWRRKVDAVTRRLLVLDPAIDWRRVGADLLTEMSYSGSFYYSTLILVTGKKSSDPRVSWP